MKKKPLFFILLGSTALMGASLIKLPSVLSIHANEDDYNLTLRKVTQSEINSGEMVVNTAFGNPITFSFDSDKASVPANGIITLTNGGVFKNKTKISGIRKVSGSISKTSTLAYGNNASLDLGSQSIDSTFEVVFEQPSDYFAINVTSETIINSLVVNYSCSSTATEGPLTYTFEGQEKDERGYAEGKVTLNNDGNFTLGDTYDFYWGNNGGKLSATYPLHTYKVDKVTNKISFDVEENISIPRDATKLVAYKNNSLYESYTLPTHKLSNETIVYQSAVMSDVHMNYAQGEMNLYEGLNAFEAKGVKYIILSGDIGETSAQFAKYRNACLTSEFTGVILSCPGNHDQKNTTAIELYDDVAMYDGATKTFINIKNGPAYFANTYCGELPIKVIYNDIEGGDNTHYYYATVGDNLYFFMDLMLIGNDTNDRFSAKQLDYLEETLYAYSGDHNGDADFAYDNYNIYIIEHAPLKQFKVGDMFIPHYGGQLEVAPGLVNNYRFSKILEEYNESIMLSGHTHVQYDNAINFVDRYYDLGGNLTDKPFARTLHVSSLAMPRWFIIDGWKITMSSQNDYSAASEAYLVTEYNNRTVFEGISNKEYTPDSTTYNPALYGINTYSQFSYSVPKYSLAHSTPTEFAKTSFVKTISGTPSITEENGGLKSHLSTEDSVLFKLGNQDIAFAQNESVQIKFSSNVTSLSVSGASYDGTVSKTVNVDIASKGSGYLVGGLDKEHTLQIDFDKLFNASMSNEYGILIHNVIGDINIESIRVRKHDDVTKRGEYTFAEGVDASIKIPEKIYTHIQFDYRLEGGNKVSLCIMTEDWSSYYGYLNFNKDGLIGSGNGVTTQKLNDDYIRVNIDFSKCIKTGSPSSLARFYVRGDNTNAYGYIDNIVMTEKEFEPIVSEDRGRAFSAGEDLTVHLTPISGLTHLSFEYRIDSGDTIVLAIMVGSWQHYYGYYNFNRTGASGSYEGVSTETLADGYIRVTMEVRSLNKSGSNGQPTKDELIELFYIRGAFTTASGFVDNIVLESRIVPRGQAFQAEKDLEIHKTNGAYTHVSFEYKIVSGQDELAISLLPNSDWHSYYGYYIFRSNRANKNYQGITTTILDDGYVKVDMDIASLNITSNDPGRDKAPSTIDILYVRGVWTHCSGYIDNVQFTY